MIRLLFPFWPHYVRLRSRWWHRLFTVLFFVSVVAVFLYVDKSLMLARTRDYGSCVALNRELNRPLEQGCVVFAAMPVADLIFTAVAVLAWWYTSQLVYRVALYVAYGSTPK